VSCRRRAVTLIELLTVAVLIGILVMLLMPAISGAWQMAAATQCKTNRGHIWRAYGMWRADRQLTLLAGGGWVGALMPYVERNSDIFKCGGRAENVKGGGGSGSSSSDDGEPPIDPTDPTAPPDPATLGPAQDVDAALEFDVYYRSPSKSPNYGALAWTIPVDSHPWARRTDFGDHVKYEIDDEGYTGGKGNPPTFDDIWFNVYYENGQPVRIEALKPYDDGHGNSTVNAYIFDLKINGEVFVKFWQQHYNETFSLSSPASDASGSGSGSDGSSDSSSSSSGSSSLIILADYGLSRGTYDAGGSLVTSLDARLFFILDYGKSVADYNGQGTDDEWHKYFIEKPEEWQKQWGQGGASWQRYQALRHFGCANVLFCDGHIESLGLADLIETDLRWRHTGR
jgi:prepilin-type processing-associated H-X9-DG protein